MAALRHPLRMHFGFAIAAAFLASVQVVSAQTAGLRILAPTGAAQIQLLDGQGVSVHSWPGANNITAHVLGDGTLLRASTTIVGIGGATGRLQRLSFDGAILWDVRITGPSSFMHHDIEPMPSGNVLVIAWDIDTPANAIANGRDPALVSGAVWLPDSILEIRPTGPTTYAVVWEWHLRDHIIQDFDPSKANFGPVAQHPELIDINYPPVAVSNGDWNHANGIDYDPVADWIILSSREQNEIYLIDHSTTTAEAAGHMGGSRGKGGDILYRWGNPAAYRAGTVGNQKLFGQHDPRFVAPGYPGAGHITIFNNDYITATQSAVFEIALPLDASGNIVLDPATGRYGPAAPLWTYTAPTLYSQFVSSAERLANGNTLVCSGVQKRLLEVTAAGQVVWSHDYVGPGFLFQTHHVARSLWADAAELSIRGDRVGFDHLLGSSYAGQFCLLLGSLSGTTPGTLLPGGVSLPLNFDFLTSAMASQFNNGIFVRTHDFLDARGGHDSGISMPPGFIPAGLAGFQLNFAHVVFDASLVVRHASNPVTLTVVP